MSDRIDNCVHCVYRGDKEKCYPAQCYTHDSWYAETLRAELEATHRNAAPINAETVRELMDERERLRKELEAVKNENKRLNNKFDAYRADEIDIYAENAAIWFVMHDFEHELGRKALSLKRAEKENERLNKELDEAKTWTEEDESIPEDEKIHAAHPMVTERHDIYSEAVRLVSAKRSKYALVDLVNWLLAELAIANEGLTAAYLAGVADERERNRN